MENHKTGPRRGKKLNRCPKNGNGGPLAPSQICPKWPPDDAQVTHGHTWLELVTSGTNCSHLAPAGHNLDQLVTPLATLLTYLLFGHVSLHGALGKAEDLLVHPPLILLLFVRLIE